MIGVVVAVDGRIAYAARRVSLFAVALLLDVGKHAGPDIEEVLLGPYDVAVGLAVIVVEHAALNCRSEFYGHFVLVVVVLDVGTEAQEHREIAVFEVAGNVGDEAFGVGEHLQTLVDAQVERRILVDGAGIAGLDVRHLERERLLVELGDLRLTGVDHAVYARREDIVDRLASGVFLDVDHRHSELPVGGSFAASVEVIVVRAPVAANEFHSGETQVSGFAETGEEHTNEANCREVGNRADLLFVFFERNLELIPGRYLLLTIAKSSNVFLLVGDVVFADNHIFRTQRDVILVVALILVERVVLVDVFDVGHRARRLVESVSVVVVAEGVTLGTVVVLIPLEHAGLLFVVVVTAVVVIVVAGRVVEGRELVVFEFGNFCRRKFQSQIVDVVLIGREFEFGVGMQTVETDVLISARTGSVVEGVSHRRFGRNAPPNGFAGFVGAAVNGVSVFVSLETVFEDVFAYLTEVKVEVAAIACIGHVDVVDKRVHKPELDVFDVRRLEVCVVEFAHNATPTALGIEQVEVGIDIRIVEVIRSAFGWVERQVERLDCRSLAIVEFAIGPNFFGSHLANIRARHLTKVVLEISRAERRILLRKHAVDVIPSKQGAILAIFDIVRQRRLGEESIGRRVVGR